MFYIFFIYSFQIVDSINTNSMRSFSVQKVMIILFLLIQNFKCANNYNTYRIQEVTKDMKITT